eukprot:1469656-Prymnesium_polylepis.1
MRAIRGQSLHEVLQSSCRAIMRAIRGQSLHEVLQSSCRAIMRAIMRAIRGQSLHEVLQSSCRAWQRATEQSGEGAIGEDSGGSARSRVRLRTWESEGKRGSAR